MCACVADDDDHVLERARLKEKADRRQTVATIIMKTHFCLRLNLDFKILNKNEFKDKLGI